ALAGEFEDTVEWTYPAIVRHYRALTSLVREHGEADPEIEVRYASTMRGWENVMKNYEGQLTGFARIDAVAHKRAEEEAVLAWLAGQGAAGEAAIDAHRRLVALDQAEQATRERDLVLRMLHNTGALSAATTLYRLAIEREKPDAAREQGYQARDLPTIEGSLRQMERRYVPEMDRELQRYWLTQYLELPAGQRIPALDDWLGGEDAKAVEAALDRLAKTRIGETPVRMAWLGAGRAE